MTNPLEDLVRVSEGASHSSSESVPDFADGAVERPTVSRPGRSPARNIFLHWSRGAFRVAALLAADITAFVLLRAALRSLRSGALSGFAGPSALANMVFPRGYLHVGQLIVALIIGLTLSGSYGPGDARRNSSRLFAGVGLAVLLTLYGSFRTEPFFLVLLQVVVTALLFGVTLTAFRLIAYRVAAVMWTGPPPVRTIVILGEEQGMGAAFDLEAIFRSGSRFEVVETFPVQLGDGLGTSLAEAIDSQGVDTVAMIGKFSGTSYSEIVDMSLTHGCRLLTTPRSSGVVPRSVFIDGVRFVELTAPSLKALQWVAKRLMDIIGSLIFLALVSPVFLVAVIAVKVDSRGPVFFSQPRYGRAGRLFGFLKLRTMRVDAEEVLRSDSELLAIYEKNSHKLPFDVDPRLTRVGRILRRWSIDELPQLFNVLAGDMSLVGPRPITPPELQQYYSQKHALLFLCVRPGLTGRWAVSGRADVGYPRRAMLELEYVRNWSVIGDLEILLKTGRVVLRGGGAH